MIFIRIGQVHGGFLILYGNRLLHVAEFFKGINYHVYANRTTNLNFSQFSGKGRQALR